MSDLSSFVDEIDLASGATTQHSVSYRGISTTNAPTRMFPAGGVANAVLLSGVDGLWRIDLDSGAVTSLLNWPAQGDWSIDGPPTSSMTTIFGDIDGTSEGFYLLDSGSIRLLTADALTTVPTRREGTAAVSNVAGVDARFGHPTGLTTDTKGNVYVVDGLAIINKPQYSPQGSISIREISAAAPHRVVDLPDKIASVANTAGSRPGFPTLAFDGVDTLYVGDPYGGEIFRVSVTSGAVSHLIGGRQDYPTFQIRPTSLAFDQRRGALEVGDSLNHTILTVDPSTGAHSPLVQPNNFLYPTGMTIDRQGHLFVADVGLRTVMSVDPLGGVSILAGTPSMPGTVDGQGQRARFVRPVAVASDGDDTLFVADEEAGTVRKIVVSTAEVTTVVGTAATNAGTTARATSLGPLPGQLVAPQGLALGPQGELFILVPNAVLVAHL
jgi:sugar lactone lactonase YvrE